MLIETCEGILVDSIELDRLTIDDTGLYFCRGTQEELIMEADSLDTAFKVMKTFIDLLQRKDVAGIHAEANGFLTTLRKS